KAHLVNRTPGAKVTRLQLVRVTSDAHYDAITVRLFATSMDYVEDEAGKLISGSRQTPRSYSEYWTLIRGTGAKGAAQTRAVCPRCGAALKITMAGDCEY